MSLKDVNDNLSLCKSSIDQKTDCLLTDGKVASGSKGYQVSNGDFTEELNEMLIMKKMN